MPEVGRRRLQPWSAMVLVFSAVVGDGSCKVDAEVDDRISAIKTNVAARAMDLIYDWLEPKWLDSKWLRRVF